MLYINMAREECAASAMQIMITPVILSILKVSKENLWPTSILNQELSVSMSSNWHCFAGTGPHSPGCFSNKLLSQYTSIFNYLKHIYPEFFLSLWQPIVIKNDSLNKL